jgi:hypothetical protein
MLAFAFFLLSFCPAITIWIAGLLDKNCEHIPQVLFFNGGYKTVMMAPILIIIMNPSMVRRFCFSLPAGS